MATPNSLPDRTVTATSNAVAAPTNVVAPTIMTTPNPLADRTATATPTNVGPPTNVRNPTFRVFVMLVAKSKIGKTIYVDCSSSSTVLDLMLGVQEKEDFPTGDQRLIFNGKQLEQNGTLSDYNIRKDNVVHMVLRLRGS